MSYEEISINKILLRQDNDEPVCPGNPGCPGYTPPLCPQTPGCPGYTPPPPPSQSKNELDANTTLGLSIGLPGGILLAFFLYLNWGTIHSTLDRYVARVSPGAFV